MKYANVSVSLCFVRVDPYALSLRWRHSGRDSVSNHQLTIVYSTVYSDADQRKHQSSVSLAFVRGIHRGSVNSPHKWPVKRKMFPFDDVIMIPIYVRVASLALRQSWYCPGANEQIVKFVGKFTVPCHNQIQTVCFFLGIYSRYMIYHRVVSWCVVMPCSIKRNYQFQTWDLLVDPFTKITTKWSLLGYPAAWSRRGG